MYRDGQGVPQNYSRAREWLRKAADQGFANAQFCLGSLYYVGQGGPSDYGTAFEWFRKVADQGIAIAQYDLGAMYLAGQGVPQNYALSHMWFHLAASQGDADAAKARDMVAAKMTPDQIAEAQKLAREWKPKIGQ